LVAILKKELVKIWDRLKEEVSERDIKWLKKRRAKIWSNYSNDPIRLDRWEKDNAKTALEIIQRIQDVCDAKNLKSLSTNYATSQDKLLKIYLIKIAELLKITVPKRTNKVALVNLIIREIDKDKERKIIGTFDD